MKPYPRSFVTSVKGRFKVREGGRLRHVRVAEPRARLIDNTTPAPKKMNDKA